MMKDLNILNLFRLALHEKEHYGVNGDGGNGCFKVYVNAISFHIIASNGGGWEHVSISPKNQKRCPTWDEMCAIKNMFFNDDEVVMQLHPMKSDYINRHPYTLHLWKPLTESIPTPPLYMV